ncbi:MAG: SAM-dependent chlorinase/fluorinase [Pseudomonadota bacterium]
MILLFTDFRQDGPYVGQMHAVLAQRAPGLPVIDLMHDAPAHDPRAAAYLLAALVPEMPAACVCCAVVDPGVGTDRPAILLEADGRWFVGPGNGLLEIVRRRAQAARQHLLTWRPERLSDSFHGRDLFAPAAARLASDGAVPADWLGGAAAGRAGADWPDDLAEVIYVDGFGNLMSGLRADGVAETTRLEAGGETIDHARVFGEVPGGTLFWYRNSIGLVEIAQSRGRAAEQLDLRVGDRITFL